MSATMETNEDNKTDATEQMLAAALQDVIAAHAPFAVDAKPQGIELPTTPVSEVSMPTSVGNGSDVTYAIFPTTPKATSATVVTDVFMPDATTESTEYDPASPSLKTTSTDTGYVSDDDVRSEEGSEIEFYEDGTLATTSGPMRKVKKNPAMTAEQQEMRMLEIKSTLRMYKANPASRDFKNAPAHLQNPTGNGTVSDSTRVNGSSAASTNGLVQFSPPKQGPKRGRPSNNEPKQSAKRGKKDKKKEKQEIQPKVLNVLAKLHQLGNPFEKTLSEIVDYAELPLDQQARLEGNDGPIKELLEIEEEWKAYQAAKLKQLTAFLERQGLIPIGGVEAAAAGRDTLS